jgi:hypothetical protein
MNMRHTNHVNDQHSLVENVYQAYHRIYHEDFCFTGRSTKFQEKPLEVQFNSQDVFEYMQKEIEIETYWAGKTKTSNS